MVGKKLNHHQVTWSLSSPFYNDVIHLTGVYIFPNEGNLEEFLDTLTAHWDLPCHAPHIYAGDFNAYTAEEIESHITLLDSHALFHWVGDTNPAHSPASSLTTATTPTADFRGLLLLNMFNSIEFIITNRRFQSPSPNHRPYTFFRKPNTYSILNYNLGRENGGNVILLEHRLRSSRHGLTMNLVDWIRTSTDERVLSGRRAVEICMMGCLRGLVVLH